VSYSTTKTFVIDHPYVDNKYLVHGCLEGPESGVYYRGKGEITNGTSTTIHLPDYLEHLAQGFTVQVTPIYKDKIVVYNASEVVNNSFSVYGTESGEFFWTVFGTRERIVVEPDKTSIVVMGDGPYKYSKLI
jgi:hypothetical protein